ncbi:MAG: hemolysin family protein [Candidatus Firestonebacteria bacterium]
MDIGLIFEFLLLVVLFVSAAFFSAIETALVALSKVKIKTLMDQYPNKAKALSVWLTDPNKLLTTILIGINTVAISSSAVGSFIAIRIAETYMLPRWIIGTVTAMFITLIIIIFGEVAPKIIAIHSPEKITLFMIKPLVWFDNRIAPFTNIFTAIANALLKLIGQEPVKKLTITTEEEIRAMLKVGAEEGVLQEDERRMIHSIFDFGDTVVREVMVPRTQMVCINMKDNIDKILDNVVKEGFTRLPVYINNLDNIIGILYAKDLLNLWKNMELIILQDVIRQPYFIPETKKVSELLKEFQKGKIHMAIVVDEFGGISGLVTLENLMEEIIGEIRDEYDTDERHIEYLNDGNINADASIPIDDIARELKVELVSDDTITTLGGFVVHLMGRIPKKGEEIKYKNLKFIIIDSDKRQIHKIKISKI